MSKIRQGWECPKCGAVMAPHISCCVSHSGINKQNNNKSYEVEKVFQPIPLKGNNKTYIPAGYSINGIKFPNSVILPYLPKKGYSRNPILRQIYGNEFMWE